MFGMRMGPDFPPVREWIAGWAERNRCAPAPVESVVTANVTRREYRDCEDGAAVLLYGVDGGGHTWPGGTPLPEWMAGATNDRVDASRTMWEFFSRYRRPDE